ncbi:WhiB family transcriptional regulator [Nesterenkonia sp. AY15]|uniref:WhiB family transcriptional regulator n=1 Tax=Nesterenkonia sp. AY15 TaxID=2901139 RepID=UPI001F4D2051|nr:WhiB family transcriptional regulator [Nesterenkonia sp. AY15]MCH8570339.1 WhiB family transcriptional regulator [Nesterenkonia sp. AY15]
MARTDPRRPPDLAVNHHTWPQLVAAMDGAITPCRNSSEWLSENPRQQQRAAALCRGCSVLAECRDFALAVNEPNGVWGGTTPTDRKAQRRRAQREKEAA